MKSILIIDDSKSIRIYLKCLLENNRYRVIEASDGNQGYELYRELKPDFVITDIFMSEMDGVEVVLKLTKEFPDVKIIVISDGGSFSGINYFDLCKKFGIIGSIKKPIDKDLLLNMIKEFE